MAAAMYLELDGTLAPPIYGTSDIPKISPVIFMQENRNLKGPSSRSLFSNLAGIAASIDVVYCSILCL